MSVLGIVACLALLQDPKKPAVDPAQVDTAIQKGIEFLRGQGKPMDPPDRGEQGPQGSHPVSNRELILWTFVHAGVPESDERFQELFQKMLESELKSTYNVALQAMILEEIDRVKYQDRIWQCAQFLVDNQGRNGQWSYGEPTPFAKEVPTGGKKDVATSGGKAPEKDKIGKPKVVRQMKVEKKRDGPDQGDNSNSQYAMLGLRACFDAGIVLPDRVLKQADRWWRQSQKPGKKSDGRGWAYNEGSDSAYGSMSAGGVASLVICDYLQKRDWKRDKDVVDGLQWLAANFTVSRNPGASSNMSGWHYYYLYGLERAALLFETETLGSHKWYAEGAKYLLKEQKSDGSWASKTQGQGMGMGGPNPIDTCFAILFLRRATRPLKDVATGGGRK